MPRKADASAASEQTAPRWGALWAAAVYALCTLSLAYPVFAGQFLINPNSDQYKAGYAFRDFAAQSLRSGHGFPQWDPYLFGGLPYVAAMHGDIFYPTFLLRMMLPTDQAMTWGFALHLFLAGMFTYAFLRAWKLPFFSSLVGGVAYMLSGQLAGLASPGHDGKLFVSALLPLVLWMLVLGMRDGRRWAWGGLALAVGLAILSPHPQLFQYLLLMAGAFALFLAFAAQEDGGRLPTDIAIKRLGLALGAVVLGACIGAIQFYPVLREYVPWSPRAGGRGYDYATTYSFPIEELINSYLPQFSGILDKYWGRNGIHLHSEYLGAVVLILAGGAFGADRLRGFRRFWMWTLVVALLWALGGNTPFYHLVYTLVPGTKFFRAPSTIYFIYAFAVAIFAAFGTERLLAGTLPLRYGLVWVGAAAVVAIYMSTGGATVLSDMVINSLRSTFPDQRLSMMTRMAADNAPNVAFGAWRSFFFVALTVALMWALSTRAIPRRVGAWILVALVAGDLWTIEHLYWMFDSPAAVLFASDPAIDSLRSAPQPGRVLSLDLTGSAADADPNFDGDGLMVHDVRLALGYHGNELGRYQHLLGKSDTSGYDIRLLLTPRIWQHENIRYLYTTLPDSLMPELQSQLHFQQLPTKIVGPVRDAAGSTVYLYRLPGENPMAWVAGAAVAATDSQAEALVTNPLFDPNRAALVDTGAPVHTVPMQQVPGALTVSARVASYAPGDITIDLGSAPPAGAMLLVSENFYPGWQASSDGQPLPTTRANYNLIGVQLSAGTRHVHLRFDDRAVERGKVITLVAMALAVLALIAGLLFGPSQGGNPPSPVGATVGPTPRRGSAAETQVAAGALQ